MRDDDLSPYAFLSVLDGTRAEDRRVVDETRGPEVRITGHMVLASKVATLYAFSGNGKSSLINAGLVPFFLELGYAVLKTRPRPPYALQDPIRAFKEGCIRDNWVPASPGSDISLVDEARQQLSSMPADSLPGVRRLLQLIDAQLTRLSASPESRSADLSAHLRRVIDLPLAEFLASAQRFLGTGVPLVVICDQFEEIFVHYYNTPAFDAFVDALKSACDHPEIRVHFLFSMREDWVGSMIAFRRAIPDILNSSYRLDPITLKSAAPALVLPAALHGYVLSPSDAGVILDDLSRFYIHQQQRGGPAVRLTPSAPDNPFIELPALQAVGDRLWTTRKSDRYKPFSIEHYASIASEEAVKRTGSPAAAVLENYLAETLESIDDGAGGPDPVLNEIRLDTLYLLTDKIAHRKALGEKELVAELRMIRPVGLGLPEVTIKLLREAILPLRQRHFIREEVAAGDETRYELAHDFVVRSVVHAWTDLDRRRVRALAVLTRRHDENEQKLAVLTGLERRGLAVSTAIPPLLLIALAGFAYTAIQFNPIPLGMGYSVLWFAAAPALVLAIAAFLSGVRGGIVVGAAVLLLVAWYSPAFERKRGIDELISAAAADLSGGLDESRIVETFRTFADYHYRNPDSAYQWLLYGPGYDAVYSASLYGHDRVRSGIDRFIAEVRGSSYSGHRYFDPSFAYVVFFSGFFLVAGYASILLALARRWPLQAKRQHRMHLFYGESIDLIIAIGFASLCAFAVSRPPLKNIEIVPDNWWALAFCLSVWGLYTITSAAYLSWTGRTIGDRLSRFRTDRLDASFGRLFVRQAIFGLWATLNVLWLLPALLTRVVRATSSPAFYDRWTSRHPRALVSPPPVVVPKSAPPERSKAQPA